MEQRSLAFVADDELLRRLAEVLHQSRRVEADVIEHIAEVDARRLYLREGSSSMFAYCTEALHLSEAEAYSRITVARTSRKHTVLLELLREGRLHLTGIALLAPYLTAQSANALLARAEHKTKRQIEELIAEIAPRPDAPSFVRRLPGHSGAQQQSELSVIESVGTSPTRRRSADALSEPVPSAKESEADHGLVEACHAAARPDERATSRASQIGAPAGQHRAPGAPVIEALAPGRYRVQFTARSELREKLQRLRALLRPQVPDGDLATVIERAVTEAIDRLEARRFGRTDRARTALVREPVRHTRHIPAAVRRVVAERNGLQCGFVGRNGRRCSERADLEYHHRHPWALDGSHDPANIGLLCRSHNAWLAAHDFGARTNGIRGKRLILEAKHRSG